MRAVAIIKSYNVLIEEKVELPFDDDRAVSEFRGFYPVAKVHSAKICDINGLNVMMEVVDTIKGELEARKKYLLSLGK